MIKFYTDFSNKITLNKNNITKFLHSFSSKKYRKETDLYVGFFGYEILCSLLNLSIKNQKNLKFYKGIFYKPETLIKIRKKITIHSNIKRAQFNEVFQKTKILSPFKLNLDFNKYQKIFDTFSRKIREGETYLIKICTKYKNKSQITLTAVRPKQRYGVLKIQNNKVKFFDNSKKKSDIYINGGFFVISKDCIKKIKDKNIYWEKEPLSFYLKKKKLYAFKHDGFWKSLDTLKDKNDFNEMIRKNKMPWKNIRN